MLKVTCIRTDNSCTEPVVGKSYYLDMGDSYQDKAWNVIAATYDEHKNFVGRYNKKFFETTQDASTSKFALSKFTT